MSSPGHEWTKHEREGWSVCSRCGMVRNYDRETTTCSGSLPKIRQRSEIEDCGWMPDHVADAILEEAGIDADKELQRAMDTVARYEKDFSARGIADG